MLPKPKPTRRCSRAPPEDGYCGTELVVRHVLGDRRSHVARPPRGALRRLLRRIAIRQGRPGLQIVSRPAAGGLLELYTTRRQGLACAPVSTTLLRRIEPIEGSCDCADFPPRLARPVQAPAGRAGGRRPRPRACDKARRERARAYLRCDGDPVRPLTGPRRLAGSGPLGRRHAGPWASGDGCVPPRGWLQARSPRDVWAAGSNWWRNCSSRSGVARRARAPRAARARPAADRARDRGRPGPGAPPGSARTLKQRLYSYQREAVERFPLAGAAPPRRRPGPREDRAGDRRLPCALALGPRRSRAARRSRRAQAAVASREAPQRSLRRWPLSLREWPGCYGLPRRRLGLQNDGSAVATP